MPAKTPAAGKMPGLAPPFLTGLPRLHVDSTVESDPNAQTWQTNSLRYPPKSRGGAKAGLAVQKIPQGKIFSATWKGNVGVRVEPGCAMYSLRFMLGGDYRYDDGHNTFCSEPNLLIPPDQQFRGNFQDISLIFIDLAPSAVERALGTTPPTGIHLHALDSQSAKNLRALAFVSVKQAEQLPEEQRQKFLRNFQNMMACSVAALLREIRPDLYRPEPMIGRRKVAELCEWAASDHEEPLTIGDLAARCGLGLRALQKNFLFHLDTTPRLYLRNLRLEKVRRLLQDTAADCSVTAAALDVGFAHLGRFSIHYREKFGESPSATLRRKRRPKPKR